MNPMAPTKSPFQPAMNKLLFALISCALLPLLAFAQSGGTGTIRGRVFNPATSQYVTNAEVRVAQAPALSGPPKARFDSAAPRPIVLAQATSTPVPAQLAAPSSGESALDALQNWLRRANETYPKAIVKRLPQKAFDILILVFTAAASLRLLIG